MNLISTLLVAFTPTARPLARRAHVAAVVQHFDELHTLSRTIGGTRAYGELPELGAWSEHPIASDSELQAGADLRFHLGWLRGFAASRKVSIEALATVARAHSRHTA